MNRDESAADRTRPMKTPSAAMMAYVFAVTDLFARIPILFPLVDAILTLIPGKSLPMFLRRNAVQVTSVFTRLNMAVQEGNRESIRVFGHQIFNDTLKKIRDIGHQPINNGFEADLYFFLSRVVFLTFGSYNAEEQAFMYKEALNAMKMVIKLDETPNAAFRKNAAKMTKKLAAFFPDQPAVNFDTSATA